MLEMVIYGVSFDMVGKQPIVLLKTVTANRFLPIWIGHPEAASILMKLQDVAATRPGTHDLFMAALAEADATVESVSIVSLKENTFFAEIVLDIKGSEVKLDARPSDALALAVRAEASIFAAESILDENGIEFEQDQLDDGETMVEEFKAFLDDVKPEDFGTLGN
jgi:bifunctional DNase/RNase